MHRLPILIVISLCFLCGVMAPAFAIDYCPALPVDTGQRCYCVVWNYANAADTNVVFEISYWDETSGVETVTSGPWNIPAKSFQTSQYLHTPDYGSFCTCKVTGEGYLSVTSFMILDASFQVLAVVPCGRP